MRTVLSSPSTIIEVLKSNIKRLSRPYKLTYAITYRCNSRCILCNIWKKPHKQELTLTEIQRFFNKNTYFRWIHFTGGEVIMRSDFIEIVKHVLQTQKHLQYINFPTNGLLPLKIEQLATAIIALHPPHFIITISMDGPQQLHDKLRGISGNWKRAVETYKLLKKLRSPHFSCYFGMTLSHYNVHYIEETFAALHKEIPTLQLSDIHINIAHHSYYYGNLKQTIQIPDDTITALDWYRKRRSYNFNAMDRIESIYQRLIPPYLQTKKTPLPCRALSSSIFLDPYGNLYPCSMWNKPICNINHSHFDITKIWNIKKTKMLYHLIKLKKCANCWTPCEAYQTILGNLFQSLVYKT